MRTRLPWLVAVAALVFAAAAVGGDKRIAPWFQQNVNGGSDGEQVQVIYVPTKLGWQIPCIVVSMRPHSYGSSAAVAMQCLQP